MGDFKNVAAAIADAINNVVASSEVSLPSTEGVRAEDIPGIIEGVPSIHSYNCYPGRPGDQCHELAFFVSLNSRRYAEGRGHLSFEKMLEHFIRHMQGTCQETRTAVIVTDTWDIRIFEKWEDNISKIKNQAHIEVYLVGPAMCTEIHI